MSYDIYIGEAIVQGPDPKDLESGYNILRARVGKKELPDAPNFPGDSFTDRTNGRHPSYVGWDEFCKKAGLHDLFFNKESGLMRDHPGCVALSRNDVETVTVAREKWEAAHPKAKPGWCECGKTEECGLPHGRKLDHVDLDGILARLLWLEWWMKWAMKNCKIPAIHNH